MQLELHLNFDPRDRVADADGRRQLELALILPFCRSCRGERWVEPPFPSMDREPCPECRSHDWDLWLANSYGIPPQDRCPDCGARVGYNYLFGCRRCRARQRAAFFHEPERVGQLGLGIG